jgi:hypothetical protein
MAKVISRSFGEGLRVLGLVRMTDYLPSIGIWDAVLVVAVSAQATVMAYLYKPRWKAFAFMLPIPFTFGSLAVGRPIDAANPAGLGLLLPFMFAVRALHVSLRLPIVPSIAAGGIGYCVVGGLIKDLLPAGSVGFWAILAAVLFVAVAAYRLIPPREEPGHRTPLPVWVKLPIMAGIIAALIAMKSILAGMMAMFPMMGTITAYEARRSLWTVCRQVPVVIMMIVPMMATVYVLQGPIGLPAALAAGWVTYLVILVPYWRRTVAKG